MPLASAAAALDDAGAFRSRPEAHPDPARRRYPRMVTLIDYGLGNIRAFANIYHRLGIECRIAARPEELADAGKLVLPGVGAFDWAMTRLAASGMRERIDELVLERGVPVLGVCVGMQMMARRSEEGSLPGLGWIPAEVRRFAGGLADGVRLPHMGWNDVDPAEGGLFRALTAPRFYFLHSYYVEPDDAGVVAARGHYTRPFAAAVQQGHIFGVQFHPEKSHQWGVQLLRNFAEL